MDLLLGLKVEVGTREEEDWQKKKGIVVNCEPGAAGGYGYVWIVFDNGEIRIFSVSRCKILSEDMQRLKNLSKEIKEKQFSKFELMDIKQE